MTTQRQSIQNTEIQGTRWAHALALLACLAITLVALPVADTLDHANVVLVYLLGVALVAMRLGRRPAIVAAVASVLLFDFFFVEPRFSFAVQDAQFLITFGVMLTVALIVGTLTARLRGEADRALRGEQQMHALYDLARTLSGAHDIAQLVPALSEFLRSELGVDTILLLPDADDRLHPVAVEDGAPAPDLAVAQRVRERVDALPYVDHDSSAAALAVPLQAPLRTRGVLVVCTRERDVAVASANRPLLDAVAALVASVVERMHFVAVAHEAQVEVETERLRSSVLSAVSHDLRTPLTVLVGLADTLAQSTPPLPAAQGQLAGDIRDEALRMNRVVENLLDMARLQSGRVTLHKAWQPLEEVVGASVAAVEARLAGRHIAIELAPDLPPLDFDAVLIERVLVNLFDNALKHASRGNVFVRARRRGAWVDVTVEDAGPGLPPGSEERIFAVFEQAQREGSTIGAGIGLAICRAIVTAHGGTISAANRPQGGAVFTMSLPAGTPPDQVLAADAIGGAMP